MPPSRTRSYLAKAGLAAGGVAAGAVLATTLTAANAADSADSTDSPTPSSSAAPTNPNPGDTSKPQRSDETLLTGDTAAKVKSAVLAKYPGATFVRVETDSDGVYEAHITTADGASTTVEVDASFAVTGAEQHGAGGRHGGPGDDDSGDSSGASAGAATTLLSS